MINENHNDIRLDLDYNDNNIFNRFLRQLQQNFEVGN